jgi:hypothetical protein
MKKKRSDMGVAAPYKYQGQYNDTLSEFNVLFDSEKNSQKNLINFIKEYPTKRINIEFKNKIDFDILDNVTPFGEDIAVRLKELDLSIVNKLRDNGHKFFFDSSVMPALNYPTLDFLISLGVSDVYPSDDLVYNLKDLKKVLDDNNIHSRIILNSIPLTTPDKGDNVKSLVFLPRDSKKLQEYVDVFEFNCGPGYDWAKFTVLYNAWFENYKWWGDIREINPDLKYKISGKSTPSGTDYKYVCGRKCSQRGGTCRKCQDLVLIGNQLEERGIYWVEK